MTGSGRVGALADPLTLAGFAELVAARLPATVGGVRAAGAPDRTIRTVAVCGGAGDPTWRRPPRAGADVYLTSDLRHHVVGEFVADPANPAVVDVAHWAGEWPCSRLPPTCCAPRIPTWPSASPLPAPIRGPCTPPPGRPVASDASPARDPQPAGTTTGW